MHCEIAYRALVDSFATGTSTLSLGVCRILKSQSCPGTIVMSAGWVTVVLMVGFLGSTEAAEQAVVDDDTAWGEQVGSVQVGLAFEERKRLYRLGDTVTFVLKIRNVTNRLINLRYTEPALKAWAPRIRDSNGTILPVMPPIRLWGGRILTPFLAPGETLMLERGVLVIRPVGWEGKIFDTVVFADGGLLKVSHTYTFPWVHYDEPGLYEEFHEGLTTGELDLRVAPAKSEVEPEDYGTSISKKDAQVILRLLGDYARDHLHARDAEHGGDWDIKREAWEPRCEALAHGAVDYLVHIATGHPDEGYRAAACDALRSLRLEANVPRLVRLLLSDVDVNVRLSAAYGLGHIGSNQATPGLVKALRSETDIRVTKGVVYALGCITDPIALPALKKALSGAHWRLRDTLERAIRNIEDPDYWAMGIKRGVSEHEAYRLVLDSLGLTVAPMAKEKKDLPDLYEQSPAGSDSYRLRKDVAVAFQGLDGSVYYFPDKEIFYIRRRTSTGLRVSQLYGPFKGNPHEIVRQAMKTATQTGSPSTSDWLPSNWISLLALLISALAAYFAYEQSRTAKRLSHLHLMPSIKCFFDFPPQGNPVFSVTNDGDISAVSVSVGHSAYIFDKQSKKIPVAVKTGYKLTDRLIYQQKLAPTDYAKAVLVRADPVNGKVIVYSFSVKFFRATDMKESLLHRLYFVDDGKAYKHKDYVDNPNYAEIMSQITEFVFPEPKFDPGKLKQMLDALDSTKDSQE